MPYSTMSEGKLNSNILYLLVLIYIELLEEFMNIQLFKQRTLI